MPSRPNVDNAVIPLMRKNEIYVDGYPVPLVESFADDLVITDETVDVYGYEQQLFYRVLDGATVRMDGVTDKAMNLLWSLTTGQNPEQVKTEAQGYFPIETIRCNVMRQTLNATSDGYNAVDFYQGWAPMVRNPQGGPKDRGRVSLEGRCKAPIRIEAPVGVKIVGITAAMAMSNSSGATTSTGQASANSGVPLQLPKMPGFRNFVSYALGLEVQKTSGTGDARKILATAMVPVTAGNVTAGASFPVVTLTEAALNAVGFTCDTAKTGYSLVDRAFVYYIHQPADQAARQILGDGSGWKWSARFENPIA